MLICTKGGRYLCWCELVSNLRTYTRHHRGNNSTKKIRKRKNQEEKKRREKSCHEANKQTGGISNFSARDGPCVLQRGRRLLPGRLSSLRQGRVDTIGANRQVDCVDFGSVYAQLAFRHTQSAADEQRVVQEKPTAVTAMLVQQPNASLRQSQHVPCQLDKSRVRGVASTNLEIGLHEEGIKRRRKKEKKESKITIKSGDCRPKL